MDLCLLYSINKQNTNNKQGKVGLGVRFEVNKGIMDEQISPFNDRVCNFWNYKKDPNIRLKQQQPQQKLQFVSDNNEWKKIYGNQRKSYNNSFQCALNINVVNLFNMKIHNYPT